MSGIANPVYAQGTPSASPFDPVINFGQTLKNNGVFLDLSYVQDVTGNVNGGKETGWMPIGNLAANAVFDLQTILGIPGASIHIGFSDRNGIPVGAIAGSPAGLLQSDQGPAKFRLSWFYWEQGFDGDRLDITAGRVNPTFDFAFSNISCSFVGVICAQPTSWYFNNGSISLSVRNQWRPGQLPGHAGGLCPGRYLSTCRSERRLHQCRLELGRQLPRRVLSGRDRLSDQRNSRHLSGEV